MRIERRILHEYPLPIARVYERAMNAEEGKDLHDRSLLLFEVLVHWLGILGLAAAKARSRSEISQQEVGSVLGRVCGLNLERPSRGTWVELIRTFAGKGTRFWNEMGSFLAQPAASPDLDRLLEALSRTLGKGAGRRRKLTLARVMDILVNYRNRTLGHGASLDPETYGALSAPFFEGISSLLNGASFLLEFPLFHCAESRQRADGSVRTTMLRLMGTVPLREPQMTLPEGLGPGALFVLTEEDDPDWFPVHPLAFYQDKSVFLYNGIGSGDVGRFLCFDDNRQIERGNRREILSFWSEQPPPERQEVRPVAMLHLQIEPKRVRAGERFLLRVEIQGVPAAQRFRLRVGIHPDDPKSPDERLVQFGPQHIAEGPGAASVPFSFHCTARQPGPMRLQAEVVRGEECLKESVEIAVQPATSLPFVGRVEAKDRIARWLDAGESGFFLLRGESGVGKSRLVDEIAVDLVRRGAVVVFGKGRKSFRFPLQPLREILLELLHHVESDLDQQGVLDIISASLRQLMPDEVYIADYFRTFLARASISPEQKAMVPYYWLQLFQQVADGKTLVAVVDDLQWAEGETIQLITELLGLAHQRAASLKVLAVVQPFGLGPDEETLTLLENKLGDLKADRVPVETLELRPLAESELDSLVDACFPRNPFRQDLPWLYKGLHQKTGGNPLFAEWVLKRLRSDAESPTPEFLTREPSWAPLPSLTHEWFEAFVPQEIESALEQRLKGLPVPARDAAQAAAAIGDPFDLRILENILGGVSALDTALPILEEEDLVSPSESPFFYRFAHSLIAQKVYRDFAEGSHWKASRLHARIAEGMSSIYTSQDLNQNALAYAHHLVLGNCREEGLKFLVLGAGTLLEQQLYASAVTHLEAAAQLSRSGVQTEAPDRALIFYRLGETYRVLGRIDEALDTLESARQVHEGVADTLRAAIELARGSIHVQRGELDAAEDIFRSMLSMQIPENQLASAVAALATIQRLRGRLQDALKEHLHALDLRERAATETGVAFSCVNVGNTYFDLGHYKEAEGAFRRSLPLFKERGLKNYLIYALSGLGNVFSKSDRRQAVKFYEEAMQLCQETGNRALLGVLHYNLGETALAEHRYSAALRDIQRGLEIMEAAGRRTGEAEARCRKAELHRLVGEFEAANNELLRAQEISKATGSHLELADAHVGLSFLEHGRGNLAQARQEVGAALDLLSGSVEAPLRLDAALMLIILGELERARKEIEEAAKAPRVEREPDLQCLLEHLRGLLRDDAREALEHFERALELASKTYRELPRLLSDLASRAAGERARELHAQALEILEQRAAGIEDEGSRRWYLFENPTSREIINRARQGGADPELRA